MSSVLFVDVIGGGVIVPVEVAVGVDCVCCC